MLSVQMDTNQDLASKDQCEVLLCYVTDVICERLIPVIDCESLTRHKVHNHHSVPKYIPKLI